MNTFKFKTNINCGGCIAKVTPSLNNAKGISKWDVDTTNPQKVLTVETSELSENEIISILKTAGYNATKLAY
ncbi:MAG: heavy-metal-associated domain-containing protein [Mariniphaga sp.]